MGAFSSKSDGYVNIGTVSIPDDYIIFVQHTRKNLMLKQFNEYIENTDQQSIYHKYIVGTKEFVTFDGITREYCLISTIFFTLWKIDITKFEDNKMADWIN